ncbi:MAG: hypothetical protein QOD63_1857 [Actinomycetota bacterium]|jgi:hypothetical protein|nr:hypothetical protein [Actinomycetota bacterium]
MTPTSPTEPHYPTLVPRIEAFRDEGLALLERIKADPDETTPFARDIVDWRQQVRDALGERLAFEANALDVPLRKRPTAAERTQYGLPRDDQVDMERALHGLDGILEILRNGGEYF